MKLLTEGELTHVSAGLLAPDDEDLRKDFWDDPKMPIDSWAGTPEGRSTVDGKATGGERGPTTVCFQPPYTIDGKQVEFCVFTRTTTPQ